MFNQRFREFVGGRFFTVKFVKKDGTDRIMTCRIGVKKYSNGRPQTADPDKYIVGWEPATKQYRNINIDTLQWVKCRGMVLNLMKEPEMHISSYIDRTVDKVIYRSLKKTANGLQSTLGLFLMVVILSACSPGQIAANNGAVSSDVGATSYAWVGCHRVVENPSPTGEYAVSIYAGDLPVGAKFYLKQVNKDGTVGPVTTGVPCD